MEVNHMAKNTGPKTLPPAVKKRLAPFIEKGVQNGIFADEKPVVELFKRKAAELADTVTELGGIKSENAQRFVANCVMTDLSAMLRQKSYTGHLNVWSVAVRTTRNGRPIANLFGQVSIEDGDDVMDGALFRMSLWDDDASLADDVVAGASYVAPVSCRNLDTEVLDLRPLSGMTTFTEEDYEHASAADLLRDTFDVTPIASLEDDISRSRQDYRLVEATVSYSGVQTSKAGNLFGKMALRDESSMTMEAIESGENLTLNAMCDTDTANRFGKYSEVLALITTSMSEQYGLSANIEAAVGIVTIAPPKVEAVKSGDDAEDNAASYFSDAKVETIDLDDEDESTDDAPAEEAEAEAEDTETPTDAEASTEAPAEGEGWTEGDDDDEWDDDWD
jgi:hypothetical protein